ncbi:Protein of unknown function (DUF1279) [Nesidiocoris tenuis]|uniref:DUF1279 domain-containing protein n=1 Tax=Nesidiocoris tenuis TaxID=355587 RepID=A0ABN7A8F7_9HEMI|nr:Protein of unknown function (DUF1279) [Nesidiocoris tenuis]
MPVNFSINWFSSANMLSVSRFFHRQGIVLSKTLSASCTNPRRNFTRMVLRREPSIRTPYVRSWYPATPQPYTSGEMRVSALCRCLSTSPNDSTQPPAKPSLYQRFKQMYKDYWYVLIPVHVATSCVWFGCFYYTAQSGFDIAAALEFLNLGDEVMNRIRNNANSFAGHITISYLLYKLFTPLRYTVTLGGTTYAIKYLTARGLLKKMPNRQQLKTMMVEKKDSLKDTSDSLKHRIVGKFTASKKNLLPPLEQHKAP